MARDAASRPVIWILTFLIILKKGTLVLLCNQGSQREMRMTSR